MTEPCDLCHSSALESIYEPTLSRRGLTVYLCSDCGLVQSQPRADRTARPTTVSNSADRKNAHTEASLSLIAAQGDLHANLRVLHLGSNRDSFARAMLATVPGALMTCVEADEAIPLPDWGFDIVHSCGTIEQRVSPANTLADLWRVLKPGGLLIIDAPNIALIGGDDIADEWFVDTQLYHFSEVTLARLLDATGFEIVAGRDPKRRGNLLFAARKAKRPARSQQRNPGEVDGALALITSYVNYRVRTQRAA
ncbi:MAG TPA: methyltransferase domain-containing protein [Micropepsaceae bacterium]|nr:methyltransferase domain-containing protein [Micropepsaceae bacterium]